MAKKDDYLLDHLVELKLIRPHLVAMLPVYEESAGRSADDIGMIDLMLRDQAIGQSDLDRARERAEGLRPEPVNLAGLDIAGDVIALVQPKHAWFLYFIPLKIEPDQVTVAIADGARVSKAYSLQRFFKKRVKLTSAPYDQVTAALRKYYPSGEEFHERIGELIDRLTAAES